MLRYTDKTDILDLDLKLFDIDENQKRKQQNRNEKHRDPNSSLSKKGNWIAWSLLAACVLCAFTIYNSGKIELDRVNAESSLVARRLDEAAKENLRLQAMLESMATPAHIDEYAAENGLIKVQSSNLTTVYVNVEKSTEVAESRNKDALSMIRGWFNDRLEFFGVG
ncbi:MAG: hypothetical protein FWG33_03315 [Oscillospiraceae bacterium]|nr:hypothetical protein [Oscillospiraceae bacterium]